MAPPKPLACVKSHVENKWLAEVHNGDLWLPYTAWQEQFEPQPERKENRDDPEWKKRHKAKVAQKAKQTILYQIQEKMTAKMTLMVLEIAARVLNKVQERLSEVESKADSRNQAPSDVTRLVNCASGVILAYRFARHSKKHMIPPKAKYYKAAAVERLAMHLDHIMIDLTDKKLPDIQHKLKQQLNMAQGIQSMASEKLDELFNPDLLEEKTDELLDMAAEKVVDHGNAFLHKMAQTGNSSNQKQIPEAILQAAGLEMPQPPLSLAQLPDEQILKARKNELVHLLAGVVREKILSKLENVSDWITFYMDQVLAVAALATTMAAQESKGGKGTSHSLNSSLQELVDSIYEQMQAFIAQEVSKVIGLIGTMMDKPFEDKSAEGEE